MSNTGYTVEVTNLSPIATEKDLYDFFSFSGVIEHIEILRSGEYASTAYVTFKEAHALETAVLLTGATIVDQRVCIVCWGHYDDPYDIWTISSWNTREEFASKATHENHLAATPGEAITVAQDVVKTMLSKGYMLSKDALIKARALDESYQVSATAAAKVAEVSRRVGLTDKIYAGVDAVRSADERYHVSETTKAAASLTGKTASSAATAVVNSSYFSTGAMWVSAALSRASQAAADLASNGSKK